MDIWIWIYGYLMDNSNFRRIFVEISEKSTIIVEFPLNFRHISLISHQFSSNFRQMFVEFSEMSSNFI